MTNWCRNILTITGPADEVAWLKRDAVGFSPWGRRDPEDQPALLNFHSLVTIPRAVLRSGYRPTGLQWELEHWGCNGGACSSHIRTQSLGAVSYGLETLCRPPIRFLELVSREFPTLHLELDYMEEMHHYKGYAIAQNGEVENHFYDLVPRRAILE